MTATVGINGEPVEGLEVKDFDVNFAGSARLHNCKCVVCGHCRKHHNGTGGRCSKCMVERPGNVCEGFI